MREKCMYSCLRKRTCARVIAEPYSSLTDIGSDREKPFTGLWMDLKAYAHHDFKWGGKELPRVAILVKLGLTKVITHLLHYLQVCNTHFAQVAAACNVPCKTQTQSARAKECDGIHFRATGERRAGAFYSQPAMPCRKKKNIYIYDTVVGLFFGCHFFLSRSSSHSAVRLIFPYLSWMQKAGLHLHVKQHTSCHLWLYLQRGFGRSCG